MDHRLQALGLDRPRVVGHAQHQGEESSRRRLAGTEEKEVKTTKGQLDSTYQEIPEPMEEGQFHRDRSADGVYAKRSPPPPPSGF